MDRYPAQPPRSAAVLRRRGMARLSALTVGVGAVSVAGALGIAKALPGPAHGTSAGSHANGSSSSGSSGTVSGSHGTGSNGTGSAGSTSGTGSGSSSSSQLQSPASPPSSGSSGANATSGGS